MKRHLVETPHGYVHVNEQGTGGTPLVLLHMTPQSTRQFDRLMADRDRYAEAIRETNLAFRERLGQQELVLARMLDPATAGEMSAVRRSAPI